MATRSVQDTLYAGPGGYKGKRPFESYKTYYGNQTLNNWGLPSGKTAPDVVPANRPPTLQGQSNLATGKTSGKAIKASQINSLGTSGYTLAANFDQLNPQQEQGDGQQGQNTTPQLMLSPSGQYQQIVVPHKIQSSQTTATNTATKKASSKKKKSPSYADSEYMSEIRALDRELADYRAKMGLSRTRAGTQHSLSSRDLGQQKDRDLDALKNDFAARGIVLSGVYGDKLGEYNTIWGQQSAELDRQYKDALTDISNQYKDYLREVGTQKEQARLAAIRRRAQKLGKF